MLHRWVVCTFGLALLGAACGRSVRHESRPSPDGGGGESAAPGGNGGKGATPGGGEGGSGDVKPPSELTIEGEFELELASCTTLDTTCVGQAGCALERRVFVIHDGELLKLAYASQGDTNLLTLLPAGDHFRLERTLVLTYLHEASLPPYSLSAGPFDVWFGDEDGDGRSDTIRLDAAGTCDNGSDDLPYPVDVDVSLRGVGVVTKPELSVQGDGWLAPVDIGSNEPLSLDSSVVLVAADGSEWPATPVTRASLYATGFTIREELPSNTDFTLEIDAQNTAGGRTVTDLPFRTHDPWYPLEDLGFEQGVDSHLVGTSLYACDQPNDTPRVTASIGNVAAIEGRSSFLVPYGQNVAILLDRPDAATKLRVSVIPLHARQFLYEPLRVQVGNRRGKTASTATARSDVLTETGDEAYPLAGPLETLELELPNESGDLLLEIQAPCKPESIDPYATAAWVDALEFQ